MLLYISIKFNNLTTDIIRLSKIHIHKININKITFYNKNDDYYSKLHSRIPDHSYR